VTAPKGLKPKQPQTPLLTELTSYADAQTYFNRERLWDLFDGDRDWLNMGHECLDRHVDKGRAVRIAHADGRDEEYTFAELSALSSRFANFVQAQGIRKGERVAIMLEPSLAFYVCLFGAMKSGAIAVPLFTLFGPDGLRLRLGDCAASMLVTNTEKAPIATGYPDLQVVVADDAFFAELDKHSADFTPQTSAGDMALFQYTSGTTRELPDAVRHAHRAVVTVAISALYATGVRPGDNYACPSSPAWGHGLAHGTLGPLGLGVNIASYQGRFDPVRMLQVLQDYEITNLSAAATHYRMMKNSGAADNYRYHLRKATFTGEPIDTATAEFCEATFGLPIRSIYGTTEVGVVLVNYPGADDIKVKRGSLGKPVPGVELAILDAEGKPCAPGQVGELMVHRRDDWFPTKDRAHLDEEGYFYHDGRADDVIISAGYTMGAVEIEDVLLKHDDVREAAVIGVPDEARGHVVKAFIITDRPGDDAFVKELQDFTRERLSQHEYPRVVEFTTELPKTPAGKVNRKKLRDLEASRREGKRT
jgi:acetyl-CoA synthetase